MKKSLLLLLILPALFFSSCSGSDDSGPPIETTSLYGTWDMDYFIQNGDVIEEIECKKQITYKFNNTKTYSKTTYSGEGFAGAGSSCVVAVIVNGTWENLGENRFKLSPNGSSADQNITIKFLDDYSKFSIKYSDNYTEVFAKVL